MCFAFGGPRAGTSPHNPHNLVGSVMTGTVATGTVATGTTGGGICDANQTQVQNKPSVLYNSDAFSCAYSFYITCLNGKKIVSSEMVGKYVETLVLKKLCTEWADAITMFSAVKKEYKPLIDSRMESLRAAANGQQVVPGSPESRKIFSEYADCVAHLCNTAQRAEETANRMAAVPRSHFFISICLDSAEGLARKAHDAVMFICDAVEAEQNRVRSKFAAQMCYRRALPRRKSVTRARARAKTWFDPIAGRGSRRAAVCTPVCPLVERHGKRRAPDQAPCGICGDMPNVFGHVCEKENAEEDANPTTCKVTVSECCGSHVCTRCAAQWIFQCKNLRCPNCGMAF